MPFSIRKIFSRIKRQLFRQEDVDSKVIRLTPDNNKKGSVLLSYILEPFLLDKNTPIPDSHTHYWESIQIANTFLDLGYSVDVISYRNF